MSLWVVIFAFVTLALLILIVDGGQVIVRFRSDGSERRLLLAYAPLKRI